MIAEGGFRKFPISTFWLLQANDVRIGDFFQPGEQVRKPPVDVVDVEGRTFNRPYIAVMRKTHVSGGLDRDASRPSLPREVVAAFAD